MSTATNATTQGPGFAGWAILEIFGHRKLAGRVQVSPPEWPGMTRIDVYTDGPEPIATQYYGTAAIFAMTPSAEALCRRFGEQCEVRPVATWELPKPKPGPEPVRTHVIDDDDYGRDYDPEDEDDE